MQYAAQGSLIKHIYQEWREMALMRKTRDEPIITESYLQSCNIETVLRNLANHDSLERLFIASIVSGNTYLCRIWRSKIKIDR